MIDTTDVREWLYSQSDDAVAAYIFRLRELAKELFIALPPEKLTDDFLAWYKDVMYEIPDESVYEN